MLDEEQLYQEIEELQQRWDSLFKQVSELQEERDLETRVEDQLKPKAAQTILEQRIEKIRTDYQQWRNIRDNEKPEIAAKYKDAEENDPNWKAWQAKLADKKPKDGFSYARMLARIDPQVGTSQVAHTIPATYHTFSTAYQPITLFACTGNSGQGYYKRTN